MPSLKRMALFFTTPPLLVSIFLHILATTHAVHPWIAHLQQQVTLQSFRAWLIVLHLTQGGWYARSITPAFNFSNTSLTNFLVKKASCGVTLQSSSVTLQHSSATFQLSNVMLQGSRGAFESSNVILQGSSATFQRSSVMPQCSGVAFQSSNVTPQRSNATFERSSVAAQPCKYSKNHSLTTKKP